MQNGRVTHQSDGYAFQPGASLEELDMGGGSHLSLRVTGEQSNGTVTVLEGVVGEGGPPLHVHDHEDEVVIVLEGELRYQVGEHSGVLPAGGLLWLPRAVPHAIANHSGAPCRFLTIVTPAGIEHFFRAQRDYIESLSPGAASDPDAFSALYGASTRRVVGPPLTN